MIYYIKNVLKKQSIIQSTLFKVTFSIFAFFIIFVFLYGQNYWQKQALKLNYNILLMTSTIQSKIQSQISSIETFKNDENLTASQKIAKLEDILLPILEDNNYAVGYYDIKLDLLINNKMKSFDIPVKEILSSNDSNNELQDLSWNNNDFILVKRPIYDQEKIVGYVWTSAKNADYIFQSFYEVSVIIILALSLSVLIVFSVRKYIKQIEFYLDEFCRMIINNNSEQELILIKLPELKPVLNKITSFTNDLKQMNLELELSKIKVIKIMEGISDGFYALDCHWQFTFVNNETQKLLSEDKTELLGKSIWEVFPQVIGSLTHEKMCEAMSQDDSVHWEAEGLTVLDQYCEYHAYPFKEGLTVFFRDITEFKRQQLELARLERLNLIGQLAAGISHEIRNPLTTVKGFLQMFGSRSKYAQDKELMELMVSEIDRANTIITDFLSLAKANSDNIKLQDINEIINKVFPMLQADAFNSNKDVVFDSNKLPNIRINENEIKQLILNLVRNVLEATPEQGSVIISTYLKEDKVVLAIKDQGKGIPQDVQEKIGTPFFTTKEAGTGLGLAISMGIAQRHKAIFEFNTGNEGTIFYTIFPT